MLIRLSPVNHEFNNCFRGQVEIIVEEIYHRGYLLTQLWRWSNFFDVVNNKISKITEKSFFDTSEIEILGLKQTKVDCKDKDKLIKKIKEELENGIPVIVEIQISNCPWDPNYKKEFIMQHIIIINGFDESANAFLCCDAIYNQESALLSVNEFREGGGDNYRKIEETGENIFSLDMDELLIQQARKMLSGENNDFQRLRNIAIFIEQNAGTIKVEERHLDNVLFSQTYKIIREFAKAREMLAYIIQEYSEMGEKDVLIDLFTIAMKKWLNIRILYVRACTANNKEKILKQIAKSLFKITDIEEAIAKFIIEKNKEIIVQYLKIKKENQNKEDTMKKARNTYANIVDLSAFYNNKAFGNFDNSETACFSVSGEYMITPSDGVYVNLGEGKVINLNLAHQMDNVICKNQQIPVELKNVVTLFIIGNKEFGGTNDNLILEYQNGFNQELLLDFPEWYTEILEDEVVVYESDAIGRDGANVMLTSFKGKIFMKKYTATRQDTIRSIRLPKDGRIHIFHILAISINGK